MPLQLYFKRNRQILKGVSKEPNTSTHQNSHQTVTFQRFPSQVGTVAHFLKKYDKLRAALKLKLTAGIL